MKLFDMEKKLRIIKNRGHFQVPTITPQRTKIETTKDKEKVVEVVDAEVVEMIRAATESEENYKREQEESKNRDLTIKANKANRQTRL